MDASTMMAQLAEVIDTHAWDMLPGLLHDEFVCRYVHTGEEFDRRSWVRLNAEYPGFERFLLQDCIGSEARAAGRSHVTSHAGEERQHFEVASFITVEAGFIIEMVEVWTDVDLTAAQTSRPV